MSPSKGTGKGFIAARQRESSSFALELEAAPGPCSPGCRGSDKGKQKKYVSSGQGRRKIIQAGEKSASGRSRKRRAEPGKRRTGIRAAGREPGGAGRETRRRRTESGGRTGQPPACEKHRRH